jgi:hypothetical protein
VKIQSIEEVTNLLKILGLVIDAVVQIVLLVFFLGISASFVYGVKTVSADKESFED